MGVPVWPRLPHDATRDEIIADIRRMQLQMERDALMVVALAVCGVGLVVGLAFAFASHL